MEIILLIWLLPLISCTKIPVISEFPVIQDQERNMGFNTPVKPLMPRMKAFNFSGPIHMKELQHHCFEHRDELYKYVFCPFSNMTQEDINTFEYSYRGILGIWGDWQILGNQFSAMRLIEGSACDGEHFRSSIVNLRCGHQNRLTSVREPSKCNYVAIFETPLVCAKNSMVVYPRLSVKLQQQWDNLYEEYIKDIYTKEGYLSELQNIFIEGGFVMDEKKKIFNYIKENLIEEKSSSCEQQLEELRRRIVDLESKLVAKEQYIKMLLETDNR